ncbi:hypothetical protein BKA70DRAFT_1239604 [Coprinopsis sp. MPI-PUGE-AT-0042]|nr:hypothetical protein BKA70DRAFT_1239604 [Coprinopsis sp. MPI-PUGE-AT-0042]
MSRLGDDDGTPSPGAEIVEQTPGVFLLTLKSARQNHNSFGDDGNIEAKISEGWKTALMAPTISWLRRIDIADCATRGSDMVMANFGLYKQQLSQHWRMLLDAMGAMEVDPEKALKETTRRRSYDIPPPISLVYIRPSRVWAWATALMAQGRRGKRRPTTHQRGIIQGSNGLTVHGGTYANGDASTTTTTTTHFNLLVVNINGSPSLVNNALILHDTTRLTRIT